MRITGIVLVIIGVLAFVGQATGSAGITIFSFFIPVLGIILWMQGYRKEKINKDKNDKE